MAGNPGARADRQRGCASNGRGAAARLQWLKAEARPRKVAERKPKNGTGHKTPPTRVPKGNPWGGKPPRRAYGPSIGCGVGARVTRRASLAPPAGLVVLVDGE